MLIGVGARVPGRCIAMVAAVACCRVIRRGTLRIRRLRSSLRSIAGLRLCASCRALCRARSDMPKLETPMKNGHSDARRAGAPSRGASRAARAASAPPLGNTGGSTVASGAVVVSEAEPVSEAGVVKLTLRRLHGLGGPVVVDWLRFSAPSVRVLAWLDSEFDPEGVARLLSRPSGDFGDLLLASGHRFAGRPLDLGALACARGLALRLSQVLGDGFSAGFEPLPGRDFFQFRVPVFRAGVEVGWVGGGASSAKREQDRQAAIVHVNLYGEACMFVEPSRWALVADWGRSLGGTVTRCDLALDFFDGLPDFAGLPDRYRNGDMKVRGRDPRVQMSGDWVAVRAATFYLGSRESGKLTRVYQKGDQLAGVDAGDPWVRAELQFGNALRVLDWSMLTDPASYFAGASDFHAELVSRVSSDVVGRKAELRPKAAVASAAAEVVRNVSWLLKSAGASVAVAFRHMTDEQFAAVVDVPRVPGRLAKFTPSELADAFASAARLLVPSRAPVPGACAFSSPAF